MKTLTKLLFVAFSFLFVLACSKSSDDLLSVDLKSGNLGADKTHETKMVTVPFVVDYVGTYTNPGSTTDKCMMNVIVDGVGTGTHVGNSTIHFDFCVDPSNVPIDAPYGNSEAYIVAANGDTLFVSVEGKVVFGRLEDHPEFVVSWWRDPFEIWGGTGRFEGATGGGMTDDYNSNEDPNSHHHWEGTITMMKGK